MTPSTQHQFTVFAQVVATGDVHRCAQIMGLSPARVEDEIDTLEQRMGFRLFERAFGTFSLTPAGRQAVSALDFLATRGSDDWGSALVPPGWAGRRQEATRVQARALSGTHPLARGTTAASPSQTASIVVAAHPAIFAHFQDALRAFEAASPDIAISLRLDALTAGQIPDLFERGLADIAYFYCVDEPLHFESRYAWSERVSLFISDRHRLADAEAVAAADLADIAYLAQDTENPLRELAEEALERTGLSLPAAQMESANPYELITLVQDGHGYAIAVGPMARDFGKMPRVARIAYAQGLPQIEVRQAIRPGLDRNEATMALAEFLFR